MARVVHFELAADDPARAVAFYANVFGWQINQWGDQATRRSGYAGCGKYDRCRIARRGSR